MHRIPNSIRTTAVWILIVVSSFAIATIARASDSPSAPEPDPTMQLVEEAARLQNRVRETGVNRPCPSCPNTEALERRAQSQQPRRQSQPSAPSNTQNNTPNREAQNFAAALKTPAEVASYVRCYETRNLAAYTREYQPIIRRAAQTFQLPEAFLTCLLFRESRFNKNARSAVGAVGLGQFMPGTIRFVSGMIQKYTMPQARVERFMRISSTGRPDERAWADVYLNGYGLSMRWKAYFANLTEGGLHRGAAPTSFTTEGAVTPKIAIGAAALYLRFLIDTYQEDLNQRGQVQTGTVDRPEVDFLTVVAGTYNIGHGRGMNVLERVTPPTREGWRTRLAGTNAETRGHMESIRNCMRTGSNLPMHGDLQRSCP